MTRKQVVAELSKMGIKVENGMVRKSDIKRVLASKALSNAHDAGNLELLKSTWDRFIDEEIKEGDHDSKVLETLKEAFHHFMDEELKEA